MMLPQTIGITTAPARHLRNTPKTTLAAVIFTRGLASTFTLQGFFRNYKGSVVNYGRSYALSEVGVSNEFLLQRLVTHLSEPNLLGMEMT